MKKLTVTFTDTKGQTETFSASVVTDETKFSAKELRKALQLHVVRIVNLDVKHGVNRGCKLEINVKFEELNTTLKPIYFGGYNPGERADKSLKAQLAVLVVDIKELISDKGYVLPQSVIDKRKKDALKREEAKEAAKVTESQPVPKGKGKK
jgi:hypothetical protein